MKLIDLWSNPVYSTASLFTMNILNLSCWIISNNMFKKHWHDDYQEDDEV